MKLQMHELINTAWRDMMRRVRRKALNKITEISQEAGDYGEDYGETTRQSDQIEKFLNAPIDKRFYIDLR